MEDLTEIFETKYFNIIDKKMGIDSKRNKDMDIYIDEFSTNHPDYFETINQIFTAIFTNIKLFISYDTSKYILIHSRIKNTLQNNNSLDYSGLKQLFDDEYTIFTNYNFYITKQYHGSEYNIYFYNSTKKIIFHAYKPSHPPGQSYKYGIFSDIYEKYIEVNNDELIKIITKEIYSISEKKIHPILYINYLYNKDYEYIDNFFSNKNKLNEKLENKLNEELENKLNEKLENKNKLIDELNIELENKNKLIEKLSDANAASVLWTQNKNKLIDGLNKKLENELNVKLENKLKENFKNELIEILENKLNENNNKLKKLLYHNFLCIIIFFLIYLFL
jgi:hypothetical protein